MWFEVSIFIIGCIFLGWAAYSDFKTRTASNRVWLIFCIVSLAMLFIRFFLYGINDIMIIFIIGFVILFYILFQLKVIPGGADVKALMCLTILIPFFVLDVLFFACIFSLVVWGLVHVFGGKIKNGFPFLLSLFCSFVFVFFLSVFWTYDWMGLLIGLVVDVFV